MLLGDLPEKLMKLFKPTLVAVALVTLMGCQESAKQEEKELVLDTEIQKQAYSVGASIAMSLKEQDKMGVALDHDIILRGLADNLADKSVIEKEEVQQLMMNLQKTVQAKMQEKQALEQEEQLALGKKFLEENAKKEGVKVTESGIQYQVLTAAEGEKPTATDTVKVHYKGSLMDGTEFNNSVKSGKPISFPLNGVIPGWTEGVQLMSVGEKYKFTIPSHLAYGPSGRPPVIPQNAVLEFEIELLAIEKPAEVKEVSGE